MQLWTQHFFCSDNFYKKKLYQIHLIRIDSIVTYSSMYRQVTEKKSTQCKGLLHTCISNDINTKCTLKITSNQLYHKNNRNAMHSCFVLFHIGFFFKYLTCQPSLSFLFQPLSAFLVSYYIYFIQWNT